MLFFMRHGESLGNVHSKYYHDDDHCFLSIKGLHQVSMAAISLQRSGHTVFDHVVSSGLLRARQTANLMCQYMNLDVFPHRDQDLNEWNEKDESVSQEQHTDRVRTALDWLVEYRGDVLCVSHYHTTQRIIDMLGIDRSQMYAKGKYFPPASVLVYNSMTGQVEDVYTPLRTDDKVNHG